MFLAMDRRIQEGVTNDLPTPGTQTYVEFMNHLAHHYDADIPTRETMNKLYRVRTEFWETTRKEINPEK